MSVARKVCLMHTFLKEDPSLHLLLQREGKAVVRESRASTRSLHSALPARLETDDSNHRAHDLAFSAGPPAAAVVMFCALLPSSAVAEPASWQPRGNN